MKPGAQKILKQRLEKNHACYVLLTCDEPTEDGNMNVQMKVEGPPILASYLLHSALSNIDEEEEL